jgi:hypothetical protein
MSRLLFWEIEVRGLLDPSWTQSFDGLTLDGSPDGSVLTGTAIDEAALYGVLALLRDTGVPIISITVRTKTQEA